MPWVGRDDVQRHVHRGLAGTRRVVPTVIVGNERTGYRIWGVQLTPDARLLVKCRLDARARREVREYLDRADEEHAILESEREEPWIGDLGDADDEERFPTLPPRG